MKNILTLLLLSLTAIGFSQKKTDTIFSKKMNEKRIIDISLPESYNQSKDRKYPLMFLMDGDYLFDPVSGAIKYGNYWDDLPEVIIVGLRQNYSNTRDLDVEIDEENGLPTQKGADFFEFIGAELLPALEKSYRIAPYKIIAGHDLTAGYINLFLYKENPLFDAYICMSPEYSTDMESRVINQFKSIKKPIFYYHCTADGDPKKIQQRILAFHEQAKLINSDQLKYVFNRFDNASHYSLVLYAIPNVLYQIFGQYQPISTAEFQDKIVTLPSGYVDYLSKKYDVIEKSFGIKMPIRYSDFKAIEAAILKNEAWSEFRELSDIAKKSYPKSMLSNYQLGMYYEKTGEFKKAFKAYQSGYTQEEIGNLTKDFMLEKADEMKSK